MSLLLDTQAWLWFVLGQPQLSAQAQRHIVDPANVKYVSPASYWEISIKISLGKYVLGKPYQTFMRQAIVGNGFRFLHISPRHTERVSTLPFLQNNHRDPFDRLLVSQASIEGMAIVSGDPSLDLYGIQRIW